MSEPDEIKMGDGSWTRTDEWGVFTTMCGEKFLATCPNYGDEESELHVLHNAISFRIELVQQRNGVVRVPFVGGVDLCTTPLSIYAHVCSAYWLSRMSDNDKKQYVALIRHALEQMATVRAQQAGLVLP